MEKDAKYWNAEWQKNRAATARRDALDAMASARRYMEEAERYIAEADCAADFDDSWKYDKTAAERAESEMQNVMRRMMDAQSAMATMRESAAYRWGAAE
jgi:hypothetical protein